MQARRISYLAVLLLFHASQLFALPDVVFVTQAPHPTDFATINSTFANHLPSLEATPRGGDLYIRYSDGSLKNITQAAGFGTTGFQGANAIAVRDPAVHWDAQKVLFSMLIGAPTEQYQVNEYVWQLYEVINLGKNDTPVITKVPNQPEDYNNVMGTYGTDDKIIFVSDRPAKGLTHTYPQLDEYESTPTNTGLWSLDPANGDLIHMDHSPSGDFHPMIDSFGRVIFIRWDHMQRDQQNRCARPELGAFNYSSEDSTAERLDTDAEVYPEYRGDCEVTNPDHNLNLHSFNIFLPWQINEDGTEIETLNHIGRHELISYLSQSFNDDPNLEEFYGQYSRVNQNSISNFFHIHEDPLNPGTYYGTNAPEFGTHSAGQIIKIALPPGTAPDQVSVDYVTHPDTAGTDDSPSSNHIGLTRDPTPLSDGALIASSSSSTLSDTNTGSRQFPSSRYDFRIKEFSKSGSYYVPTGLLTSGITKSISYWDPDQLVTRNNVTMWELQPKEIRARVRPNKIEPSLPEPEKASLEAAGVSESDLKAYLKSNGLALIVGRDITTRDNLDHQQPLNLRVAGSDTKTIKESGKVYDVAHLQIFQGDLVRGYGGVNNPRDGRRVIAQALHSVTANPSNPDGPPGSVKIAADGSFAAVVPARRALTYQLTDESGAGVVRERFWLSFQPGEIRVCASCHGVNSTDQKGNSAPENPPAALFELARSLQDGIDEVPPEMSLAVTSGRSKKTKKKLSFQVTGNNAAAAFKEVDLHVQVGKRDCDTPIEFMTDAEGNFNFSSTRMPGLKKKTRLNFALSYNSETLATASYKLRPNRQHPVAKKKFCKRVIRAITKGKQRSSKSLQQHPTKK